MTRKRRLNIGHRGSKKSNQHAESNNNEGIESSPTNATSTHVSVTNAEEIQSSPRHREEVIHGSVESHANSSEIEAEQVQAEKEPKRTRGPTRMLDVWEMEVGDVIIVNLDKHGRPVGEEATTLTRFIGSMVRRHQYAPINYYSWKKFPKDKKKEMLDIIESKFEFDPPINDTIREMLKSEMNEKWRQWKSDIKSIAYNPCKTEEEVASKLPDDRVEPSQYRDLVHHWYSESAQKTSEINRRNHAKFEDVHCMGTKSLPKLIDQMKKKGKGVVPTRKEIYIHTRTRKDGTIVNEKAAGVVQELNKHIDAETSQSTQNTQRHTSWKNDIFSKVQGLEKRGRVRCMGKMPKSKKSKVSLSKHEELSHRVNYLENLLTNFVSAVQNRLPGEEFNDIARQVADASSARDHLNSPSSSSNEDSEYDEDD